MTADPRAAERTGDRRVPRSVRVAAVAIVPVLLVASLLLHLRLRTMAYDDAYIHLRIVRNLLQHGHAWFNPGERVMATSSPLWTALLAVLHASLWPLLLPAMEAVLLWAAAVLACWLAADSVVSAAANSSAAIDLSVEALRFRRRALPMVLTPVAGFAVFLLLLSSSVGQMETPLAIALLLCAWAAALRARAAALPLLACAAITRLEWLPLFFVAAALWFVWTRRWQPIVAGCTVVALAAGWTLQQFGVLLPNSMRAKQIGYSLSFARALQEWVNPRLRDELICLFLLIALLWCAADAVRAWRSQCLTPHQAVPLFAAVGALVVAVEYVARHTVIFPWYRPLVMVPLLLGLLLYRPALTAGRMLAGMWLLRVAVCAVVLSPWCAPAVPVLRAAVHPTVAMESRIDGGDAARVQTYLQAGEALRGQCAPARVMAPEIGALGWAFGGYMYDGFGIASPGAMKYQPLTGKAPRGGLSAGFVHEVQPDVIVSYTVLDEEPRHDPWVLAHYRLLALPTSAKTVRGGLLDMGWRSSPHLNVWVKHGGVCNATELDGALRQRF